MKSETTARRPNGLSPLAELVRRHDRERYLTALFAPQARREALFALYAFNYEIARVRESVTQPMLGRIRLQWWRETVAAAYEAAETRRHEVAEPLTAAIRRHGLSREHFDRLIDAREGDLDDEPPPTLAALEDYAEGTSSRLIYLALEVLGVRDAAAIEAARETGIGYALAGLIRALPFHARAGRTYIPAEIAARARLDPRDYAAPRASPALRMAIEEIAAAAAAHLAAIRQPAHKAPRAGLPALLAATCAARGLRRLRRAGFDPFDPALALPDPLLGWRLAAALLFRR